jgi:hypothetical protein
MSSTRRYWADLGERAGKSFVQGFLALWFLNPAKPVEFDTLFSLSNLKAGVAMAAMSIGTSILGKSFGNPNSASVLPPEAQPVAPAPVVVNPPTNRFGVPDADQLPTVPFPVHPFIGPVGGREPGTEGNE